VKLALWDSMGSTRLIIAIFFRNQPVNLLMICLLVIARNRQVRSTGRSNMNVSLKLVNLLSSNA
jgi:hypothetical protein